MAMLVARAICPKCQHEEFPIRHRECKGALVKQAGTWKCYDCQYEPPSGCQCDNCGHTYHTGIATMKWGGEQSELAG